MAIPLLEELGLRSPSASNWGIAIIVDCSLNDTSFDINTGFQNRWFLKYISQISSFPEHVIVRLIVWAKIPTSGPFTKNFTLWQFLDSCYEKDEEKNWRKKMEKKRWRWMKVKMLNENEDKKGGKKVTRKKRRERRKKKKRKHVIKHQHPNQTKISIIICKVTDVM